MYCDTNWIKICHGDSWNIKDTIQKLKPINISLSRYPIIEARICQSSLRTILI